jgi:hypothetical protein
MPRRKGLTRSYSVAPSRKTPGAPGLEMLKGRPLARNPQNAFRNASAPTGLLTSEPRSQGKLWAKLPWPVGPKTRLYPHPSFREMSQLQSKAGRLTYLLGRFAYRDVRFLQIKRLERGDKTLPASDEVICRRTDNREIGTSWYGSDGKNRGIFQARPHSLKSFCRQQFRTTDDAPVANAG